MKLIRTVDAEGAVLCHDILQGTYREEGGHSRSP